MPARRPHRTVATAASVRRRRGGEILVARSGGGGQLPHGVAGVRTAPSIKAAEPRPPRPAGRASPPTPRRGPGRGSSMAWAGCAHGLNVPDDITLVPLPPYSPELNPVERVWLYLRERFLSNRVLGGYTALLDAACRAWNALAAEPGRLTSLTGYPYLSKSELL